MVKKLLRHWIDSYRGLPRNVWMLAWISLINRFGSMVIIFMTLYLTEALHYNLTDAGYALTWFGLGAIAGNYLGGWLSDRLGFYRVMLYSLIGNGLCLLLVMITRDFWLICALLFCTSAVADTFRPANQVAVGYYCGDISRTRAIGLLRMTINLSFSIAPAVAGFLAYHYGWNWLFWIDALTCFGAAIFMFWMIPAPPRHTNTSPEKTVSSEPALEPVNLWSQRPFLVFVGLTLLVAVVFMQMIWIIPAFFRDVYHWDKDQIGWMIALNGAIVFLVEMPYIFAVEKRKPSLWFVQMGTLMYLMCYLSLILPLPFMACALLYILLISLGEIHVMPFSFNYAFELIGQQAKGREGKYLALYGMTYATANVITPLLSTQIIARWGYHSLWWFIAALSAIALAGFWWMGQPNTQALLMPNAKSPASPSPGEM
jgi:MFS family permease